jgi:la-related protein 1
MSSPTPASPAPETASTPSSEAPKAEAPKSISWAERARQNIPADAPTPSHIKSVPAPPSDDEEDTAPAPIPKANRNRNSKNKNAEKNPANEKPRNPRQNTDGKRPAKGGKGGEKGSKPAAKKEGNATAEGGSAAGGEKAVEGESEEAKPTPVQPPAKKKGLPPAPSVNPWKVSNSSKVTSTVPSSSPANPSPASEPAQSTSAAKPNGKSAAPVSKDESSWPEPSLAAETKEEPVKEKKVEEAKGEENKEDEEKPEKKKGSNKKGKFCSQIYSDSGSDVELAVLTLYPSAWLLGKKNWVPISPAELQASVDQAAERSRKNAPKPKRDGDNSAPRPASKGKKASTSTSAGGAAPASTPSASGTSKKALKKAAAAEKKEKENGGAAVTKETIAEAGASSGDAAAAVHKEGGAAPGGEHVESGPDGLREGASTFVPSETTESKPVAAHKGGAGGGSRGGRAGRGRGGGNSNNRNSHQNQQAAVDPSQGFYLQNSSASPMLPGAFPPLHHVPGVGSFPIGGFIPPNPPVIPTRAPPANPANTDSNRVYYPPPLPMPVTLPNFPLDSLRFYVLGQLEHYFSAQNLAMDFFLRQQVRYESLFDDLCFGNQGHHVNESLLSCFSASCQMDSLGFVSIPLLATFNRVKQLTEDLEIVKETLGYSQFLEVRGDKVRLAFGAWQQWVLPTAPHSDEVDVLPISTEEEEAALNDHTPIPSRADTPASE